jgi:hypothetical protein
MAQKAPGTTVGSSGRGSATRKLAPLIPVALPILVGLAHGVVGNGGAGTPVASASPPAVVRQQGSTSFVPENTLSGIRCGGGTTDSPPCAAPYPMLTKGHPVEWFFVFKLNASVFPKCGDGSDTRTCTFDSGLQAADYKQGFGQRYLVSSNEAPALADGGPQCVGTSTSDPVGATFDEVYNGGYHYLIWNDQFHDLPPSAVLNCPKGDCGSPWGHSKGMLAWNDAGEGFVMQVSTPSWPGAGNPNFHRKIGNTLGCIVGDDDVGVSQHFFALHLNKSDLIQVLTGLNEASVATDPTNPQVASSTAGSPPEIVKLVSTLGVKSNQTGLDGSMPVTLSSGVQFIAKPSGLHVPPWQMVSAELGGVPLRAATWWADPYITSTTAETPVPCWDSALAAGSVRGKPGAVDIAATGTWGSPGKTFRLESSPGTNGNHAKVGVSTTATDHYAIFGDENQQGTLGGPGEDCGRSQNGRGGMFFVLHNEPLSTSLGALIEVGTPGAIAPPPKASAKP